MTRERAIRCLFILWVSASLVATLVVSMQMLSGKYGEDGQLALNWLLIQYTPILSVLLAAVFSDPSKRWREGVANQWRFRWALAISIFQILLMLCLLLLQPFFGAYSVTVFSVFERTQPILAILQGLGVAAVGSVIFDGR